MKVFCDTSILVALDRADEEVIVLLETINELPVELAISTVTVSEILVGVYLQSKPHSYVIKARELLAQFKWYDMNAAVAEEAARLIADRIKKGRPVDYQDNIIAATFLTAKADYLVTKNVKHFTSDKLAQKVYSPDEFMKQLSRNS